MPDEPKRIVEHGYDAIAERYAEWAASFESPALHWLGKLLEEIDEGSRVLEIGCGGGGPVTRALAERHRLIGVDISSRQIERARERVPTATFRHADVTELEFEPASFDAVVSLFMLGHVPRAEQARLLASVASWLRPGVGSWLRWGRAGPRTRSTTIGWAHRCSSLRSTSRATGRCSAMQVSGSSTRG
jgi:ubiquinone/menaquinone biosynthesis C-methylase UbiE